MRRSVNVLADTLANEGVGKEFLELDDTWINILDGELRKDYNHLATKDREGGLSMEGQIKDDIARPRGRYAGPRKDRMAQQSDTIHHARL